MPLVKEIETLTRLHADGALSDAEFRAAKQAILDEIPVAEETTATHVHAVAQLVLSCLLPPLAAAGLVFALGIPALLSLTLGVTILAGLLIARFRETDG